MATDRIALPTENYEPYYRSLNEFDRIVEENSDLVARIAKIIDVNLAYPHILASDNTCLNEPVEDYSLDSEALPVKPNECIIEKSDTSSLKEEPTKAEFERPQIHNEKNDDNKTGQKSNEMEVGSDTLRDYIDNALLSEDPMNEPKLEMIKSDQIRKLLQDNFRLSVLKKKKTNANQKFMKILSGYELLLVRVILPRLSQQFSTRNLRMIEDIRSKVLPQRNEAEANIWKAHVEYVEKLGRLQKLTDSMTAVTEELIELPMINRLGAQLEILKNLMEYTVNEDRLQKCTLSDRSLD